jgi:hypothetical protein
VASIPQILLSHASSHNFSRCPDFSKQPTYESLWVATCQDLEAMLFQAEHRTCTQFGHEPIRIMSVVLQAIRPISLNVYEFQKQLQCFKD